ncbi:putative cytochrome P450 monooxygenase [Xylaria intraflava]|nr:putative cytochrome P450 monooxygenase [Xylaria intraflava]
MADVTYLAQIGLVLGVAYLVGEALYNAFLHPLRKFPGPVSHRLSALPRTWYQIRGCLPFYIRELHERYGPVVRLAPDELIFSNPQAWHDIYARGKGGTPELPKYEKFYHLFGHLPRSILNETPQDHGPLRRRLAHGFSERSMREQEPIIGSYVNLLVSRLRTEVEKTSRQDLRRWYNWTTFDLIGDLSFGVDGGFECLQKPDHHSWVELVSTTMSQGSIVQGIIRLGLGAPIVWLNRMNLLADNKHRALVREKLAQRLKTGERPDFLEGLISNWDELGLDYGRLTANASLLIVAGSETTATLLAGATYFLVAHPEILQKLQQEVRSSFKSDEEITLLSVGNLSYMLACLNESLRCHPPVASGLPRTVPQGGTTIDGHFIPQGTIVSVVQWAINHDERFWTEPDTFTPERWLGDPKYKGDQLDVMQPFSTGPRNCVGRNLAYAEMRLILAKIVYNFDISLADESRNWIEDQKVYDLSWKAPPLNIHLKPVVR